MIKKNVISLFSGAGGLDYGFKKAGYSIIGSAEIMKEAVKTHNFNFNLNSKIVDLVNKKQYNQFINNFKDKKIDLLIGGFPCQGYSIAGKRNLNDERNQLYKKVVNVLKDLKINKFILENVLGILSIDGGKEIKKIEKYFNKNGYFFKYIVLDSSNFNVPQKRKRVIFIGTSIKKEIFIIKNILNELNSTKNKLISVKNAIKDLENLEENKEFSHIFTKHTQKIKEKIKSLEVGKSLYKNYADGWRKIIYNKSKLQ